MKGKISEITAQPKKSNLDYMIDWRLRNLTRLFLFHSEILAIILRNLTNLNADIENNNNSFKPFKYGKVADGANAVFRNAAKTVPFLKYLSNFYRLLETSVIICKIEWKLKWTKHCVLAVLNNENGNANSDSKLFTLKGTELYLPGITLSVKDNEKLFKRVMEEFEISVYWNEVKTKSTSNNTKN